MEEILSEARNSKEVEAMPPGNLARIPCKSYQNPEAIQAESLENSIGPPRKSYANA